jgi:excisionase family DNA binding protein
MDAPIERQALSVSEASHVAGIGRTKLYEAIGAGQLAVRKFGKRTIVLREDLSRFLAALPVTNVEIKPPSAPAGRSPKSDRTASAPRSRTVVEQLPAVASKAQPKEGRERPRLLNPSHRSR